MKEKQISSGERKLYHFIYQYSQKNGYTPSYQEMVDHTSSRTKSHIAHQLKKLENAGWIEKAPHRPRAIRLNHNIEPSHTQGMIQLLGVIQAGAPIPLPGSDFAMFLPEDAVDVGSMIPQHKRRKDLFALRVLGDSMIDSNVQDGDIVVMEKAVQANNGVMVAAWMLEDEATTLKHFYKEKNRIRLQPANPRYDPIYCQPNKVQIQGRVVMVIRSC